MTSGRPWDVVGMQGREGIWYAGSSVSFESLSAVMEYNKLLLRQMVPRRQLFENSFGWHFTWFIIKLSVTNKCLCFSWRAGKIRAASVSGTTLHEVQHSFGEQCLEVYHYGEGTHSHTPKQVLPKQWVSGKWRRDCNNNFQNHMASKPCFRNGGILPQSIDRIACGHAFNLHLTSLLKLHFTKTYTARLPPQIHSTLHPQFFSVRIARQRVSRMALAT